MEILGQRPVWSMSGSDMLSTLDAAYAEIARLETLALHLIAGLDATGHAQELGAGTTARLLTFRYRIDATKARRDVRLATSLEKFPAVAAALPDPNPEHTAADNGAGEENAGMGVLLHPAQAEEIVAALDKVPATVPAEDLRVAEQQLVELGRTHGPLDLRKAGRLIRDRLDTDGPEPAEQKAYDRESLTLKNADSGVAFTGYLANENAELFRTLIHTHAKPHKTIDGALDPRPRTKRQADALTTILTTTGLARGTTAGTTDSADTTGSADGAGNQQGRGAAPGHGSRPHITVTIDFNDLKAATADKLGHLSYGDALSAATIRRLACDAHILPIVLGSNSQPLDVGTTVRLATGPIRKALITRDKGCVCCGAPPIYCDAHHVVSWIDGGETNITNLALLCKRCHRDLHAGHWNVHITDGTVHVARPTWATPDPVPRGRYRPPTTTPQLPTPDSGSTTTDATTRPAADATTPGAITPAAADGSTPGAPARAWPRDTDPPWITPDDTAGLNPWGEDSESRPQGVPKRPTHNRPTATGVDVWGETMRPNPTAERRSKRRTNTIDTFDPSGDLVAGPNDGKPDHDGDGDYPAVAPLSHGREPTGPHSNAAA